jgi:hypothetical protein
VATNIHLVQHVRQEAHNRIEYMFFTKRYRKHDPKKLVAKHANQVISHWTYSHASFEENIFIKNSLNWDEVLHRREKPDLIRLMAFP